MKSELARVDSFIAHEHHISRHVSTLAAVLMFDPRHCPSADDPAVKFPLSAVSFLVSTSQICHSAQRTSYSHLMTYLHRPAAQEASSMCIRRNPKPAFASTVSQMDLGQRDS